MAKETIGISPTSAFTRILDETSKRGWRVGRLASFFSDLNDRGEKPTKAKIINRMPAEDLGTTGYLGDPITRKQWRDAVETALDGFHIDVDRRS